MDPTLFTRSDATLDGQNLHALESRVRRGKVDRLRHGMYATEKPTDDDAVWRRELRMLLLRCESDAAIGGIAAAILHRLDGFEPDYYAARPLTIVTSVHAHVRDKNIRRSRSFDVADTIDLDGLQVFDRIHTVAMLGRWASADEVEMAMESMFRGADPRRPDVWNRAALKTLTRLIEENPRRSGYAVAAQVLRRRGNVLPTGSGAETRAAIAFRNNKIDLVRQCKVRVIGRTGRVRYIYWLDFADVSRRLAVEIDGRLAHGTNEAVARDDVRENLLNNVFTVVRFSGSSVRSDPAAMCADLRRRIDRTSPLEGTVQLANGWRVVPTRNGVDLYEPA